MIPVKGIITRKTSNNRTYITIRRCQLKEDEVASAQNPDQLINGFISSQVTKRGLDKRTEKAYRLDLEHFYMWLFGQEADGEISEEIGREGKIEAYLNYLSKEKKLRASTISRKSKVFGYYLSYLARQGVIPGYQTLQAVKQTGKEGEEKPLSKLEIDAFFNSLSQEYQELDSDFRKRICLRDQVMMKLLFFHGIEISELLIMEVQDYDWKTGILKIRKNRELKQYVQLFSKDLKKQLEKWLEEHGNFEHNEEFHKRMFLSKLGRPLSMKMVINIFEKYRIMAGIEKECTPKDLKNSMNRYGRELVMEQCR